LFYQREKPCLVLRTIGTKILRLDTLELPPVLKEIAGANDGLTLVNQREMSLDSASFASTLTPEQRDDLAASKGFLAPAVRETQGCRVRDLATEAPFNSCDRLGFETSPLLLMPVSVDSETLGLIALGGHQPDQFDLNDLNLARGVARQAAQAILNARHREEDLARARHGRQYVRF